MKAVLPVDGQDHAFTVVTVCV